MNGMEMLLKQLGIDPGKIVADFTSLKDGVTETLKAIDARLTRMEIQQQEIRQWQMNQSQPPQPQANQPAQLPAAQLQPNPQLQPLQSNPQLQQ